jgi:hypothetical protein
MEILHPGACQKYLLECGICGARVVADRREMREEDFYSVEESRYLPCNCLVCGGLLRTTMDKGLK